MKGYKIVSIIKVSLGDTLLELYFNIEKSNQKFYFQLSILDDGETISFLKNTGCIDSEDIKYEAFDIKYVSGEDDELEKLFGNEIFNIHFGIGKTLFEYQNVIYYFKMTTNKNNFLFFNNGDEGAFSFDQIEEILANDIYGFEWSEKHF